MEKKEDSLEAIKKFTRDDNIAYIGLDDTFGFKCQQCGKCCMNREDIILNPFDVYNGAKYLGITPSEFLNKYCFTDLGSHSKMPMVLLATTENGFCPLLKFDVKDGGKFKCTIHPAKPSACANHPIGSIFSTNLTTGEREVNYIKVAQCSNSVSDEQQIVREWIKSSLDNKAELDVAREIQYLATKHFDARKFWLLLAFLHKIAEKAELDDNSPKFSIELLHLTMSGYLSNSIGLGYTNYDINKPFIEQAEENIKELSRFYDETKRIYEIMKSMYEKMTGKVFDEEVEAFEKRSKEQEE